LRKKQNIVNHALLNTIAANTAYRAARFKEGLIYRRGVYVQTAKRRLGELISAPLKQTQRQLAGIWSIIQKR
jgi:hypothetical protein